MRDGKLKPDCFSDARILGFPPGVGVLLIFFNRFHNHIAENLALIDENGRFSRILNPQGKPKPSNAQGLYDEALFQTARLVTTGLYINIIMKDYVRTILNLNRVDSQWNLDPRTEEGKAVFGHKLPEATGNSVSAEFNLVYRWHSCVSERDEQWTKDTFTKLLGHESSPSMDKFLRALNGWALDLSPDPLKRDFAGLQRLPDGTLHDQNLAAIWSASVEDVAGSYGAGHVPEILKNVEILGIMQSRSWNLASLNEFREYFKLEPHKTFEDINPDTMVADALRRLYGHPDNVEIYPGIVVEAAKEPRLPGSGLCANFTTSRAILSDAVALVRGDRFYTIDYTPGNLTNFGFNEANYDLDINYGTVFYKLVLTALPNSYGQTSIYAHYPLVVPVENQVILTKLKKAHLYSFGKPTDVPVAVHQGDTQAWKAVTDASASHLLGEAPGLHLAPKLLEQEGLYETSSLFYKDTITKLLQSHSYQLAGCRYVDVVRDVFNIAHAQFVANLFLLPKDDESELIALLSAIYVHGNAQQPAMRFVLGNKKAKARQQLTNRVHEAVDSAIKDGHGTLSGSTMQLRRSAVLAIQAVSKSGLPPKEIAEAQILPLAALVFVSQSRVFAEALDLILGSGDGKTLLERPGESHIDSSMLQSALRSTTDQSKLEDKLAASTAETAFGVIFEQGRIGRAAGPTGRIRRLKQGVVTSYLNAEESTVLMYPASMVIKWGDS